MTTATELLDCGHPQSGHGEHTTGYGVDAAGKKSCYACCAVRDRRAMEDDGRATLYLSRDGDRYKITNWPGSLRFDVAGVRKGRHNIAGTRTDAWFTGPDGAPWHGVQYGEYTELVHCRRVKR